MHNLQIIVGQLIHRLAGPRRVSFGVCMYGLLLCQSAIGQIQSCPVNISFSTHDLSHWLAYTGNNRNGNGPSAIKVVYDSASGIPSGTMGATSITEYNLASTLGIQVNGSQGFDPFGGFPKIPNINGYQYNSSIILGSTAVSSSVQGSGGPPGGYIRGISYSIDVPASAIPQPYTMTYAYAMVLENGTHNSNEQPLFTATLSAHDSVIECASPKYLLPTSNTADRGGRGAILDTTAALASGFRLSNKVSPNENAPPFGGGTSHLQDVWTKGWREVTFDLSPFRGQRVTLTFEADNCIPGGHFAYAYVALRNNCAGLLISGNAVACTNSPATYSIPGLNGASYHWTVPGDWTIGSGADSNILQVTPGLQPGVVTAEEINGCADLKASFAVSTSPSTLGGLVNGDSLVCAGGNSIPLLLTGYRGRIVKWIGSTNGTTWDSIPNVTPTYLALNLNTTTTFRVLVQNGPSCAIDSSAAAVVQVDQLSLGGAILPAASDFCLGQDASTMLNLKGFRGQVSNWQWSPDDRNWNNFSPALTDSMFQATGITATAHYRIVVKNGVCPADTSNQAVINYFNTPYPQAQINPADTTICYGGRATLAAVITNATSYTWTAANPLENPGSGQISGTPFSIAALAPALKSDNYVLSINNIGCPNALSDTFRVHVLPEIVVDAGRDTAVVVNEPLQLHAISSEFEAGFNWSPGIGLNDTQTPNPLAIYDASVDSVRYLVTATAATGCTGTASILVKVFKTGPDIFVPNAFTPGKRINPIFRPIPVGIASLRYFRVFNRWGQLVFYTERTGQGWDGMVNGRLQDEGAYVWMVEGITYTGKRITKKGVMVLIR